MYINELISDGISYMIIFDLYEAGAVKSAVCSSGGPPGIWPAFAQTSYL